MSVVSWLNGRKFDFPKWNAEMKLELRFKIAQFFSDTFQGVLKTIKESYLVEPYMDAALIALSAQDL